MTDAADERREGFRSKRADITPHAAEVPDKPLGPFGGMPLAYIIVEGIVDEDAKRTIRTHYVYASPEYCRLARCALEDLIGFSHLEVIKSEFDSWAESCYKAIVCGETTTGVDFSPITQSWVCYSIAPTSVENCCVCAFLPIDEQQRIERMSADERTSQVISNLLEALAGEEGYEVAMNKMLDLIADVLPADRLAVYVCNGSESKNAFERCVEGAEPQLGTVSAMSKDVLKAWFNSVSEDPIAVVPDTKVLARFSPPLYEWCVESGIKNLLAAPFYNEGEIVGFLGAYNFKLVVDLDADRIFSALSSYVGAHIANHKLLEQLEWASEHDVLTGLLNRRGALPRLRNVFEENPDAPLVLALLDLDDFKSINDQFGHAAGDKALEAMGRFLTSGLPRGAILCRMGGDEFFVALTGKDAENADEVLGAFMAQEMSYEYEGEQRPLSTSLGYVCLPSQTTDPTDAFTKADTALYAVKHRGKAGYLKYSSELES